jgi:hypothetical protein
MKKLTQVQVEKIFVSYNCLLLDSYEHSSFPLKYKCFCGNISTISLNKFKERIQKNKGCKFCKSHNWTKEQDEILKRMYGKSSRNDISIALKGVNKNFIKSRAKFLKLKGNVSFVNKSARKGKGIKNTYNYSFFSKISNLTCYWAGFLAADGCVLPKKNTVSVRLHEKDKDHLCKLQKDINHNGKIFDLKKENQCLIQLHSAEKLIEDLMLIYNITSRKSNTLKPPNIKACSNVISFICGYIDGTGFLNSKGINSDYHIQIYGTEKMLNWIKKYFDKWVPPIGKKESNVTFVKKYMCRYAITGVRVKVLIAKLLSVDIPRMTRKWSCYQEIKKQA